jgi:hypothetical protein
MSRSSPSTLLARLLYDEGSQWPAHLIALAPIVAAALVLAWAVGWLPQATPDFDLDDQRDFVRALNDQRPALNIESGLYRGLEAAMGGGPANGDADADANASATGGADANAAREALRREFVEARRDMKDDMDSASVQLVRSWNGPISDAAFEQGEVSPAVPSKELIATQALCPMRGWSDTTRPIVRQLVILGFSGRCSDFQIFAARSPALYHFGLAGWFFILAPVLVIGAAIWFWRRVFKVRAAYRWLYRSKVMYGAGS